MKRIITTLVALLALISVSHAQLGPSQAISVGDTTIVMPLVQLEEGGSIMTTRWMSGDQEIMVVTPKREHESTGNQAWRHKASVNAARQQFPPTGSVQTQASMETAQGDGGSIMQTAWLDNDGMTHSVTTPQRDGEDPADQVQRHAIAVNALKAAFPPKQRGDIDPSHQQSDWRNATAPHQYRMVA